MICTATFALNWRNNMSKIEILVAAMHKENSLIDEMNIKTDAVIANQCDENKYEEIISENGNVKIVSTNTKGVGINRNLALLYSTKEILAFADDDVVYVDNYDMLLEKAFNDNKKADIIIFNTIGSSNIIEKTHRVKWYNFMRYGTVRIAMKRESQRKANVWFSTLFGGGARYSAGEDSLFLHECLEKGLNIYAVPLTINKLEENRPSTWFEGYTRKYFYDKGILFSQLSSKCAKLLCLQLLIRHRYMWKEFGFLNAYKVMIKGIKEF
jgi:glycosyltransferase involved in cell wall biosynthesis